MMCCFISLHVIFVANHDLKSFCAFFFINEQLLFTFEV